MPDTPAQPGVLILACGNPMRGDDGVGPIVAEQVESLLTDEERLRHHVIIVHQLLPELALPLSETERAVLIDARLAPDDPAGAVHVETVTPEHADEDAQAGAALTHHWTFARLLAVTGSLYGRAPSAHTVSILAEQFDSPDTLSAPVAAAMNAACVKVLELIRDK